MPSHGPSKAQLSGIERARNSAALAAWEKDDNALHVRTFIEDFESKPVVNADSNDQALAIPSRAEAFKAQLAKMARMMDDPNCYSSGYVGDMLNE